MNPPEKSFRVVPTHASAATILIFISVLAAYLPALRAGYVWDDTAVTENPAVRLPHGIFDIWFHPSSLREEAHYWPMVYSSFWLENHLWGLHPLYNHLVNVALHAINSVALGFLLCRLRVKGAWLAAAIFALHPVHVESVAWVIERKDLLCAFFFLLAVRSYLIFSENRIKSGWIAYGYALLFFLCAVLSKTAAVTLPFALAIGLWWKNERLKFHDAAFLIPFVFIAAMLTRADLNWARHREIHEDFGLSISARALTAGRATWFYIFKLLWPMDLMAIYPRWRIQSQSIFFYVLMIGAMLGFVALWFGKRRWKKATLASIFFFALTLAPVLGLVDHGFMRLSFVADRFQYLPSMGLIALLAAGAMTLGGRLNGAARGIGQAAMTSLLVALGLMTWRQSATYHDSESLWSHNVQRNPGSWEARNYYGLAISQRGEAERAIAQFSEAVRLNPKFTNARNNLGYELLLRDRLDEAAAQFEEALRVEPKFAEARANLGLCLARMGQTDEAVVQLNQAIRTDPASSQAYNNLGTIYAQRGKLDEAIIAFSMALRHNPNLTDAKANLEKAQEEKKKAGKSR